jgi:hypothetical protein
VSIAAWPIARPSMHITIGLLQIALAERGLEAGHERDPVGTQFQRRHSAT